MTSTVHKRLLTNIVSNTQTEKNKKSPHTSKEILQSSGNLTDASVQSQKKRKERRRQTYPPRSALLSVAAEQADAGSAGDAFLTHSDASTDTQTDR